MKKTVVLIVLAAVVIGAAALMFVLLKTPEVEAFDLQDYQYYVENYPSDENVGKDLSEKQLLNKAEEIWVGIYGKQVKWKKPYQLFYDQANGVWLVRGSLPPFMAGGVPCMLIEESTGDVLAVWHEK